MNVKVVDCLKLAIVPLATGVALFGVNFTPVRVASRQENPLIVMAPSPDHEPLSPTPAAKSPPSPSSTNSPPLASPAPTTATQTTTQTPPPQAALALSSSTTSPSPTQSASPTSGRTPPASPPSSPPVAPRPVASRATPTAPSPTPASPVSPAASQPATAALPELVTFAPLPADAPSLMAQVPQDSVRSEVSRPPITAAPTPSQPTPVRTNNTATTQVTVFTIDSQCNDFRQTQLTVPTDKAMETAIGKVLEDRESGDFSLGGYRISVKGGVATVDLRPAPHSERSLHSLTHCEQLALFGGIRRTLLGNTQWRIQDVQFTITGEELYF